MRDHTPRRQAPQPSGPSGRSPASDHRHTGWRSRDILRAVTLAVAVYYLLRLAWAVSPVLLTLFLGVLFGLALSQAVDWLQRFRVPRGVAAAAIVLALYGGLAGMGAWVAPTLRTQGAALRDRLPQALERAEGWLEARSGGLLGVVLPQEGGDAPDPAGQADTARSPATAPSDTGPSPDAGAGGAADASTVSVREAMTGWLRGAGGYVRPILTSTAAAIAGLLLVTFVALYLAIEPATYRNGLLLLVPREGRERAEQVLGATGVVLRRWLVTQLIGMVIIGLITTVALLLLGIEAAVALGVLAGLLEFIPFLGPILAAAPAIAMGFLDSPEKALAVTGVYLVIQQLESNLLMPLLMREGLRLPPILTLLAQGVMALLFGFIGVLVAVPLLAAVIVPIKLLYVQDVVGEDVHVFGVDEDDEDDEDEDESNGDAPRFG